MIGYGRGGGGGFGGFPYRSSHQQGQDGRGGGSNNRSGRGRGRGGRQERKPRTPQSSISIAVELNIPPEQRGLIVGKGGRTLAWLREVSEAKIFVPHVQRNNRRGRSTATHQQTDIDTGNTSSSQEQVNRHPVRVKSAELSSILHAFAEISRLLSKSSDNNDDFIPCIVKMKTNNVTTCLDGKLFIQNSITSSDTSRCHCLFSGTISEDSLIEFNAYSIETTALDEESVSMIVDNILFVDSSLEQCKWFYKETTNQKLNNNPSNSDNSNEDAIPRRMVFAFGSDRESTKTFFEKLKEEISTTKNGTIQFIH